MPIQINNVNVIDDSRNFSAAGIATISSVTINGSTSTVNVGTGITLSGSTGNISIAGTISAAGLIVPIQVSSFNPSIGSTGNSVSGNIVINFNQTVGLGTTGFIWINVGTATTQVIGVGAASTILSLSNGGRRLTIVPTNLLPVGVVTTVMSNGFVVANGQNFTGINTVGTAQTYFFTTRALALGDSFGGGNLICQSGGVRWIAAPSSSEVSRTWYCRADANITAQSVSGCTGWFIPSITQLQNPAFSCRTYWTYSSTWYWSDTQVDANNACALNMGFGGLTSINKTYAQLSRSFRCVTY